jgi:hypothetical protein
MNGTTQICAQIYSTGRFFEASRLNNHLDFLNDLHYQPCQVRRLAAIKAKEKKGK